MGSLGFTLPRDFEPREIGLLYYVMASSQTLGDGLRRVARYSRITNEALVVGYFSIAHHRSGSTSEMARFVGAKVEFGADTDEFALDLNARELPLIHSDPYLNDLLLKYCEAALANRRVDTTQLRTRVEFGADTDELALKLDARDLPLIHSDPYLNDLLLKYCEAALADRRGDKGQLRTSVENAISTMLPHGRVLAENVARSLGMSERTLARKLSDERLNFTEILQQLRRNLAVRYLDDRKLHVSKIAWLLGFNDVSAFTHAYKRWTGKTPSQMRAATAY